MNNDFRPKVDADRFVIQELADELLVYDLDKHCAYALNETSMVVWQNADGKHTITEIARELSDRVNRNLPEELVWMALERLERDGLIAIEKGIDRPRMGRREMIRDMAAIGAVSLPLIASIVAPLSSRAQSVIPLECATCLTKQHEADLCPTVCDDTILGDCHDNSGCGVGQIITQETCVECYARYVPGPSAATFSWHGRQYKP